MGEFYTSVHLDKDLCKGCINCIKRCPTEAIRVRNGKAVITKEYCIDCGECIRICKNHAKLATTDSMDNIHNYKYVVALPAPSLYAQANNLDDVNIVLSALKEMGFDDVFEVSAAAEVVSLLSRKYIEDGIEDTGAVNIVAGMILDYRAFDTLGESHVLFIAAVCVMILLKIDPDSEKGKRFISLENDRAYEPKNDPILVWTTKILVPVIITYGVYIILNGHLSPGGGFSGGAIIGAGLILYLNAFGFKKTEKFFTQKTFSVVSVSALLFYSVSKTYAFFTGANGIHSFISKGTPGDIISAGLILPLNICVGAVVACTMYSFYGMFRKGGL